MPILASGNTETGKWVSLFTVFSQKSAENEEGVCLVDNHGSLPLPFDRAEMAQKDRSS
jgi:DNA helicase HerA-like ATPase